MRPKISKLQNAGGGGGLGPQSINKKILSLNRVNELKLSGCLRLFSFSFLTSVILQKYSNTSTWGPDNAEA